MTTRSKIKKRTVLKAKNLSRPWPVRQAIQALLIIAAGWWIYAPAMHAPWFSDDTLYFTTNALLQDPWRIFKAWFEPGSFIEYYPITESVQWCETRLWGNDPFGYHVVNVLFHLINALLVWRLLAKFRLKLAWLGGLLFAIHPLQVESVVWISELKNTLSLTPFLLAMAFYMDYDESKRRAYYLGSLGLFLVAMLCKLSAAPFPAIILLYAWWKRGRLDWNDLRASAPFFFIPLILGPVTIWSGQHYSFTHHVPLEKIPLNGIFSHLALVGLTGAFYFAHSILPIMPLPCYPLWSLDFHGGLILLPWLGLGIISAVLWEKRFTWGRHAILALGVFFICLAPFLGFTTISYMNSSWVMDHFHYVAMIGLFGLVVAALEDIGSKLTPTWRRTGGGLVVAGLALLALQSHAYAGRFVDGLKFWSYALEHNPGSWMAHYNVAASLLNTPGREAEAIPDYQAVVQMKPELWAAYIDWGCILLDEDRPMEAKEKFVQALKLRPEDESAHFNLGLSLEKLNEIAEAMAEYREAIKWNPDFAEAHYNLAHLLYESGQMTEALTQLQRAVELKPKNAAYHCNLADVLSSNNRAVDAIAEYQAALAIDPDNADARNNLGKVLIQNGQNSQAEEQFKQALSLRPEFAEAHLNLGIVLLNSKDVPEAIQEFRAALAANPNLNQAHLEMGKALEQNGQKAEAAEQYNEALQLSPLTPTIEDFVNKVNQQAKNRGQ